jgi:hypothetical protein
MTDISDIHFNIILILKFPWDFPSKILYEFLVTPTPEVKTIFMKVLFYRKVVIQSKIRTGIQHVWLKLSRATGFRVSASISVCFYFRARFLQREDGVLSQSTLSYTGKSHTQGSINMPLLRRQKTGGTDPSHHWHYAYHRRLLGQFTEFLRSFISFSFLSFPSSFWLFASAQINATLCTAEMVSANLADSPEIYIYIYIYTFSHRKYYI